MPPLLLRIATPADADAIVRLVQSAYRGDSSRGGWTTEADHLDGQRVDAGMVLADLAVPGTRILLVDPEPVRGPADPDGDLLACVLVRRLDGGIGYIGMFAVDPGRQAAGTGSRLLAEAERLLAEDGVAEAELTVLSVRPELAAFYERRGYRATGDRHPFPYGDDRFGAPLRGDLELVVYRKPLD